MAEASPVNQGTRRKSSGKKSQLEPRGPSPNRRSTTPPAPGLGRGIQDKAHQVLRCVECQEIPDTAAPKLLGCYHNICQVCLHAKYKGALVITCKQCKNKTEVKGSNVDKMQHNFLIKPWKNLAAMGLHNPCVICRERGITVPSTHSCLDCGTTDVYLCSQCVPIHTTEGLTKGHQPVILDTITPDVWLQKIRSFDQEMCTKHSHPQEKLFKKFTCNKCDKLVCRDCVLLDHKGHPYVTLGETTDVLRANIKSLVARAQESKMQDAQKCKVFESILEKTEAHQQQITTDLEKRRKEMKLLVDEVVDWKLRQVAESFKQEIATCRKNVAQQRHRVDFDDSVANFMELFAAIASDADFYTSYNIAHRGINSVFRPEQQEIKPKFCKRFDHNTPEVSKDKIKDSLRNVVGDVVLSIDNLGVGKAMENVMITGLAVTEDEVMAVAEKHPIIMVFAANGDHIETVKCSDLNPWDIDIFNGDVYVTDVTRRQILKVDRGGKVRHSIYLPPVNSTFDHKIGICVSTAGEVFTCSAIENMIYKCHVDDTQVRPFIKAQSKFAPLSPYYIFYNYGKVYVSNWKGHNVHVYDPNGTLLHTIGKEGTTLGPLKEPMALCVDPRGVVFVCERGRNRILIISDEDEYLGYFPVNDSNFRAPFAATVTKEGIIIVSNSNRQISFYRPNYLD